MFTFELDGEPRRLTAYELEGAHHDGRMFLPFLDATSGTETYGAGRYLHAPRPDASGRLMLDFNTAYNPPCAYTSFATCPLPPPQNKLGLRIMAGEKRFPGEKALYEASLGTADGRR